MSGASERTSEWPCTYVSILVCSRPQCDDEEGVEEMCVVVAEDSLAGYWEVDAGGVVS